MSLSDRHLVAGAAFVCVLAGCSARHGGAPAAPSPESGPAPNRPQARAFPTHCTSRWTLAGVPGGLVSAPNRALRRLGLAVRAARSADSTGIQLLTDPSPFPPRFDDGGAGRFLLMVEMLPAHPGKADSTAVHLEVRVGPIGNRWLTEEDSVATHVAADSLCAAALRATKSPRSTKGRSA